MASKISGRYEEVLPTSAHKKAKKIHIELRVDVDGKRPMNVLSGDIYSNSGKTRKYRSSFIFERVKKIQRQNEVFLLGESGKFDSESENLRRFRVRIPINSYPLVAEVSWIDNSGSESRFWCRYRSEYFRRVHLQNDHEEGVIPLNSYDRSNPSSPTRNHPRPMTIADAYAEAGIEIIVVRNATKPVPHPKQIPERGSVWTDSALDEVMTQRFDIQKAQTQWRLWLFSAFEYEIPEVKGIMFIHEGHRRGCAVFHRAIGGESDDEKRMLLYVYVHELGHCFNLQHPWVKTEKTCPAGDEGYSSLSWMSCPQRYYSSLNSYGETAFWKDFRLRFDDSELIHLRHGFRNDVVFGGNASRKDKTDL